MILTQIDCSLVLLYVHVFNIHYGTICSGDGKGFDKYIQSWLLFFLLHIHRFLYYELSGFASFVRIPLFTFKGPLHWYRNKSDITSSFQHSLWLPLSVIQASTQEGHCPTYLLNEIPQDWVQSILRVRREMLDPEQILSRRKQSK